jgi:hypothetical protein
MILSQSFFDNIFQRAFLCFEIKTNYDVKVFEISQKNKKFESNPEIRT